MYIRKEGYDRFLLRVALSFGTTIKPWSSKLMVVIKAMINEINSVAYMVGELQI